MRCRVKGLRPGWLVLLGVFLVVGLGIGFGAVGQGLNGSLELPPRIADENLLQAIPAQSPAETQLQSGVPQPQGEMGERQTDVWVPRGTPTWGALAKDFQLPGSEGTGIANNWLTQEDAAREAMQRCYQNGGVNCYLEATYSNRCLGIALADDGRMYWEINVTRSMAAQSVVGACSQKSTTLCRLAYAECSYPVP